VSTIEFGNNGEWLRPRDVQVQFQGIVGAGIEQFRDSSRQTIVWPPELASEQLQFPYAQSVDVNATLEAPSRGGVNTEWVV
jgi:branched-chain amino acid transport system substrate-binding protein